MIPAAILLAAAVAAQPASRCTLCHPDVRVAFEHSRHRAEEVACTDCHGGDPAAVKVEAAHSGRFRGIPKRRDIPSLCSSCHSDLERMRGYNIPTDQYALYQTSRHGRLLAKGDEKVAICTDCHGPHEILPPDDPSSSVSSRNIPKTCGGCHSDPARMSAYGLRSDPTADFAAGVHGEMLLEKGSLSAPDCTRCHGAHGATPPGVGDVNRVCGQCHKTTRVYFLEGPHRDGMRRASLPECASCHDHHKILPAGIGMLDSVCLKCHEKGSSQERLSLEMKTLYSRASEEIDSARSLVDRAAAIPLYVEDYLARLEEARTTLLESLPVTHSLDLGRVEEITSRARSIAHEVESELSGKLEGRKWRQVGLLVFWFYLLLTVAILLRFRRRAMLEAARR